VRPTVLSEIESPRRRRYMSTGLNGTDPTMSPPSIYIDPITGLLDPPDQPAAQPEVYRTADTTITRMPTPHLDPTRTPPRSNRNLDDIHGNKFVLTDGRALMEPAEELDFNVFDDPEVSFREAGNPFLESTPTEKGRGSPTSPETPRRSKRLQTTKDEPLPRTPSRVGLDRMC
jgi:hypothetical protein